MNLISIKDLDSGAVDEILKKTFSLKTDKPRAPLPLSGKTLGLVFEKPSNRTRVSFEVGMFQLGGFSIYLSKDEVQLGRRESAADVARVLSRYIDCIVLRTFSHDTVLEFAASAGVPVINGLSDRFHPCQGLADVFTIKEKFGDKKVKLCYVGDGNNVCHSLLYASAKTGIDFSCASPEGFMPLDEIVEDAKACAETSGARIEVFNDPVEAVRGADVVYTDVWASMGQEHEKQDRKKIFAPYRLSAELMARTGKNSLVMHCLPAYRGEEITDEVMDGPGSIVFDQAENRMHVQKAILLILGI